MSDPKKHPLIVAHDDPEDVGMAGGTQRNALIMAGVALARGAPWDKIVQLYGGYAACRAKLALFAVNSSPEQLESEAVAVLSHQLRFAAADKDVITASKVMLDYANKQKELRRRYDDETLGDSDQRQRAEAELSKPSQLLQDLIVDTWTRPENRIQLEPLLLRLLRGCEDLIRSEGWIRVEEAADYVTDPGLTAVVPISPISPNSSGVAPFPVDAVDPVDSEYDANLAILESILEGDDR